MIEQLWQREKLQLEMKNLELVKSIDLKNSEIQQFEKKLQHLVIIMFTC